MQQNDRDGQDVDRDFAIKGDAMEFDAMEDDSMEDAAFSDRLVWQRLVDNRLSDNEYRALLLDLETKPGLWRDCALAFLEDQALKQALARWQPGDRGQASPSPPFEVFSGPSPLDVETAAGIGQGRPDGRLPAAQVSAAQVSAVSAGSGSMRPSVSGGSAGGWSQPLLVTVSLAAGFLLAVFAFSQRFAENGGTAAGSQFGVTGVPGVTPAVPVGEPVVMDRESFKDFLADLPPEQRRELFQRPTQQRVSPTVAARPASLVPGQVEAERRFLFYRMADGGTIVVPVDDYRFVAQEFQ